MNTLLKIVGVLVALAAGAGFGYLMFEFPKVPPPEVLTLEPTRARIWLPFAHTCARCLQW